MLALFACRVSFPMTAELVRCTFSHSSFSSQSCPNYYRPNPPSLQNTNPFPFQLTRNLDGIPEKRSIVPLLALQHLLLLGVLTRRLVLPIASRIFFSEVPGHVGAQHQRHALEGDQGRMSRNIAGGILREVQVRRDGTTQVAKPYVHGDAYSALQGAADVVAVPGDTLGDVGVDAAGEEKAAGVLDSIVVGDYEHQEADDSNRHKTRVC